MVRQATVFLTGDRKVDVPFTVDHITELFDDAEWISVTDHYGEQWTIFTDHVVAIKESF